MHDSDLDGPNLAGYHKQRTIAFENGNPVLSDDPNIADAIDGTAEDGIDYVRLAQGFRENLRWIFVTDGGRPRDSRAAFLRFVAFTAVIYPEAFNNESCAKLGKRFGVHERTIANYWLKISRGLRMRFRRMHKPSK